MDFVFSASIWITAGVAVAGVALLYSALRRGDRTLRIVGVVLLLVGLAWTAASRFIETDTEAAARQSREVVQAVSDKNWTGLSTLLHADASLALPGPGTIYDNRAEIIAAGQVAAVLSRYPTLSVNRAEAHRDGASVISEVDVMVGHPSGENALASRTTWRFVWKKVGTGLVVRQIEGLDVGPFGGRGNSYFPRPGG